MSDMPSDSIHRFIPTAVGNAPDKIPLIICSTVHPHGCGERAWPRSHVGHPRTVHPHGCGERPHEINPAYPKYGSSPRLWGTLQGKLSAHAIFRFIPTAVGNAKGRVGFHDG